MSFESCGPLEKTLKWSYVDSDRIYQIYVLSIVASTEYVLSTKDSLKSFEGCSRPGCLTECYMQTQTYYTSYLYILLHLQNIM